LSNISYTQPYKEENKMFGLEALDVLIGLVTVYLVFGLACTAIVEAIAAWLSLRSGKLEAAMKEFFHGNLEGSQTFVKAFYGHPLVQALSKGNRRPSYIPPETVGWVVEALVTGNGKKESLTTAVDELPGTYDDNRIKGLLKTFVTEARGDAAVFRKAVETQFNAVMDRASGWVKRRQQTVALIVSALLVIGANVDTVGLATSLASNPEARAAMVKTADELLTKAKANADQVKADAKATKEMVEKATAQYNNARAAYEEATSITKSAGLQIGWKGWWTDNTTISDVLAKVAGLLVSIFAVSLGAPFWFDMLQRFMQVRATGSREEAGEKKKK
jgi:hypothetical protein